MAAVKLSPLCETVRDPLTTYYDTHAPIPRIYNLEALRMAKRLYLLRRRREGFFAAGLFSDPAWDMLLDLFVSGGERRRLSVSAVCIGSGCASATALRYVGLLEGGGWISRSPDETDRRRDYIELTDAGWAGMSELIATL